MTVIINSMKESWKSTYQNGTKETIFEENYRNSHSKTTVQLSFVIIITLLMSFIITQTIYNFIKVQ